MSAGVSNTRAALQTFAALVAAGCGGGAHPVRQVAFAPGLLHPNEPIVCALGADATVCWGPWSGARLRDAELEGMCRAITGRLFSAIQVLRDAGLRADYDAEHLGGSPPDAAPGAEPHAAKAAYERGMSALGQGRPRQALGYFRQATDLDANTPRYAIWSGWARFQWGVEKNEKSAMLEGHQEIRAAVNEARSSDEGYVLLAKCYEHTGDRDNALRYYRKALGINRRNREAVEGRRRLEGIAEVPRRER